MSQLSNNLRQMENVSATGFRIRSLRRLFDLQCAILGLAVLSPMLLLIALFVKLDDRGPIFYRQQRIGKNSRPFGLWKFRTMVVGADKAGLLTEPGDRRITRVGAFLRNYKLDELPQLFNVLVGDMQLVGARPEVFKYVDMFRPQYELILREAPGITDPASLAYRREEEAFSSGNIEEQYVTKILPDKIRLSLDYQQRRTFFSDVRVLFSTILDLS
jgi:lipopolysaccharide/colanic/teichoic acid biosynthesis glycosyltransferase